MELVSSHPIIFGAAALATLLPASYKLYDSCRLSVKPTDLTNKVVVITGGNRGIGKETVKHLAEHNATVIVGCRDVDTAQKLFNEIKTSNNSSHGELIVFKLDLSSFKSVREFADRVLSLNKPINYLINNAGLIENDPKKKTPDGIDWMYQINHLSHFLLTKLLLDNMLKAAAFGDEGRIINLSSGANDFGKFDIKLFENNSIRQGMMGYCDTKLMNILFSNYLNQLLQGKNMISVSLHPGVVASEFSTNFSFILRNFMPILYLMVGRTEKQGAMTTLHTIYTPKIEGGRYYDSCRIAKENKVCKDKEVLKKFWELSEKQTGVKFNSVK